MFFGILLLSYFQVSLIHLQRKEESKATPLMQSHPVTSTQRVSEILMDSAATKAKTNTGVATDEALAPRVIKDTKTTKDTKTETKEATPDQRKA